ncbi:MAG: ABC transporter permease subunit [Anaerolineaceae bacterium]|nr:ABC transporter permease subunit [Anaerolineaceae bacterium]
MNIFFRELRSNLKSLLIWSGIVFLFSVIGFSKFSAFYNNPELTAILDSMPPAVISALSMNAFNLTTVTGFFGIMILYFSLILAISAAMWGSDIISKEERDRTVEFSLTLPVTRNRVVNAKTAAAAVNCIILLLVMWGATVFGAQNFNPDNEFYAYVSIAMLAFLLLQMVFLALGIFLGCALKRYKLAGSAAIAVILVTYFTSILSGLNKDLDFLKYFTPFKYFDAATMLRDNRLEWPFVLLSAGIIIVLLIGAHIAYRRRDLYI